MFLQIKHIVTKIYVFNKSFKNDHTTAQDFKMVQNVPTIFNIVLNGPKWSEFFEIVQNCLNCIILKVQNSL